MRVFISSVRSGLQQERDYLPDLINAVGHESSRFEDFGAVSAPSRKACLDGVRQADAYLLILGPHYGADMADSGVAATEEEFNVAQQRGMPIFVFKKVGVDYDEAQNEFMDKIGDYQEGRFWAEFEDVKALGIKVVKALKDLELPAPPLTFGPLAQPVTIQWRTDRTAMPQSRNSTPVLEAHAVAVEPGALVPVSTLQGIADRLAVRGRESGFFGQGDALSIGFDDFTAWAVRENTEGSRDGHTGSSTNSYAGFAVGRDGSAVVFQCLPTDMLGALVSQDDLTQRLTVLYRSLVPSLPGTEHVALAAALDPLDRVVEGDPSEIGNRSSGTMGMSRGGPAQAAPVDEVPRSSLGSSPHEIATELAVRLMQSLRTQRSGSFW